MKNTAYMLEKRSAMLLEQARLEGEVPASVEKFMELLHTETFHKEVMNCDSAEAVKELLDRNGIDFTMEEIDAILIAVGNTLIKLEENDGELTEEDLEQVAGGWSWGGFFKGLLIGAAVAALMVGAAVLTLGSLGTAGPIIVVAAGAAIGGVVGGIKGDAAE
jgi:hypothetical protein